MQEILGISEVYHAAQVLREVARHPRIIGVTDLNPEAQIFLKPENLQHTALSSSVARITKYRS